MEQQLDEPQGEQRPELALQLLGELGRWHHRRYEPLWKAAPVVLLLLLAASEGRTSSRLLAAVVGARACRG